MVAVSPGVQKVAKTGGIGALILTAITGIGTSGAQYMENSKLQETIIEMHRQNSALAIECFAHLSDSDLKSVNEAVATFEKPTEEVEETDG